jgi:hypothetical protein
LGSVSPKIKKIRQNDLSSIFFNFGPEASANGTGIAYRQHDVVVGGLLGILGNLNPALQEATKTPLDIAIPQQPMTTNPLEGLNPIVETLLVAKIHNNDPTHKSLRYTSSNMSSPGSVIADRR